MNYFAICNDGTMIYAYTNGVYDICNSVSTGDIRTYFGSAVEAAKNDNILPYGVVFVRI